MNSADRKWFVMLLVAAIWIASTVFVFLHPTNFSLWCGLCVTMAACYHWLTIHDSKVPNAEK